MDGDTDDETMVPDLEYISANIIQEGINSNFAKPFTKIPPNIKFKIEVRTDSDTTTSSESSENDEPIDTTGSHQSKSIYKVENTIKSWKASLEEGELSSENDKCIDQNINSPNDLVDDSRIKNVHLTMSTNILCFGAVLNVLENTMVVKADQNAKVLDIGTSVFLQDRSHVGEIYDVFGRIELPFYSIVIKRNSLHLVNEGVNVYYSDAVENVFFVNLDKINTTEEAFEGGLESEKSQYPSSQRKRNNQSRYKQQGLEEFQINNQIHINAWPPTMKMLKNSYDVRTFYKYGQWPSAPPSSSAEKKFAYPLTKKRN